MSKSKTIVKHCSNCNKPFSTSDDSIVLCRECTDKTLKEEAEAELNRQNEVVETRTCGGCGKSFNITVGAKEFFDERGLTIPKLCPECRDLLKKRKKEMGGMAHVCKTCGKTFTHSALSVIRCALKGQELFEECPECRKTNRDANSKRKEVVATLSCKECGKEFNVTAGEKEFFVKHGLEHMPARCPECRHKRKVRALAEDMRRFGTEESESVVMDDVTPLDDIEALMPDIAPEANIVSEEALAVSVEVVAENGELADTASPEEGCGNERPTEAADSDANILDSGKTPWPEADTDVVQEPDDNTKAEA